MTHKIRQGHVCISGRIPTVSLEAEPSQRVLVEATGRFLGFLEEVEVGKQRVKAKYARDQVIL